MKRMKKMIAVILSAALSMLFICGCGDSVQYDENGNALITSDWELVEYTSGGNTEVIANIQPAVRLFTKSKEPAFSCSGSTCVFMVNEKKHKGTITDEGGYYSITYNDTKKGMFAEIHGDELVITNETGSLEFVFHAKH